MNLLNKNPTLVKDLSASLVVFLVAMPLCIGIALASGAPPAKGILTGIVGGIVVGFFAGSPWRSSSSRSSSRSTEPSTPGADSTPSPPPP